SSHQRRGGFRTEDLPSMSRRQDPGGSMQCQSPVIPIGILYISCMQGHPNLQITCLLGPLLFPQRLLAGDGALQCFLGALKGYDKAIPRLLDLLAARGGERFSQGGMMDRQRLFIDFSGLFPLPGGTCDVGEEEGEREGLTKRGGRKTGYGGYGGLHPRDGQG